MFKKLTPLVTLFLVTSYASAQVLDLAAGFKNPPGDARPQVWWHWANGHISAAGITADLEAMKRVGIGGGTICNVATLPEGQTPVMSPQWWNLTSFAVKEAARLGLELGIENCDGWSSSGGPWITPADSMKMVVWSEAQSTQPGTLVPPPMPYVRYGYYRDTAAVAFPTPASESGPMMSEVNPEITLSSGAVFSPEDRAYIFGGSGAKSIEIHGDPSGLAWIEFSCPQQFFASSIRFAIVQRQPKPTDNGFEWLNPYPIQQTTIEAMDESKNWRTLSTVQPPQDINWQSRAAFPLTKSRNFRLVFKLSAGENAVRLASVNLLGPGPGVNGPVRLSSIINLRTNRNWHPTAGRWTVIRFGATSTGAVNHPASAHGLGLECDKLSRQALDHHFAGMMDRAIRDAGPLAGKSLVYSLIDSYEVGSQNWTNGLSAEFNAQNGYDAAPWLVTLTGRTVESEDLTHRFTHDLQVTLAGLFDSNYWGYFSQLLHNHGMKGQVEAYGNGNFDSLHASGLNDMPMSEFWYGNANDGKLALMASSAAHTYGRRIIGAESFTANQDWNFTPWNMKIWGDWIYSQGVNRYYFHSSTHQPDTDGKKPGTAWGNGIYLTRNLTWWNQGEAYFRYLARCQYVLQSGQCAADILSYEGDDCLQFQGDGRAFSDPPPGYRLDGADHETLMKRISVSPSDGSLFLPSGARYRLLILPNDPSISLDTLRRIASLVSQGAIVFGPRPAHSAGLRGYPGSEEQVKQIANVLWGAIDGKHVIEHTVGRGKIVWTGDYGGVSDLLRQRKVLQDFSHDVDGASINYLHRTLHGQDLYFVANHEQQRVLAHCTFRISGKAPELWNPESGEEKPAPIWRSTADGRTEVTLDFEPGQSIFVVFRKNDAHATHFEHVEKPAAVHSVAQQLRISHAVYGILAETRAQIDVTARLSSMIRNNKLYAKASNDLAGSDPAPLRVKSARIDYTIGGKPGTITLTENDTIVLPPYRPRSQWPLVDTSSSSESSGKLYAWEQGNYLVQTSSRSAVRAAVTSPPYRLHIEGPWEVKFDPAWGGPRAVTFNSLEDWTKSGEDGIKHYSGTAIYSKEITLPPHLLVDKGAPIYLNLGDVHSLAEVRVNGHALGVLWKPPYRVEVGQALVSGTNRIVIAVTNTWVNRLIGDSALTPDKKYTHTTIPFFSPGAPLDPSGLLGPVELQSPRLLIH